MLFSTQFVQVICVSVFWLLVLPYMETVPPCDPAHLDETVRLDLFLFSPTVHVYTLTYFGFVLCDRLSFPTMRGAKEKKVVIVLRGSQILILCSALKDPRG